MSMSKVLASLLLAAAAASAYHTPTRRFPTLPADSMGSHRTSDALRRLFPRTQPPPSLPLVAPECARGHNHSPPRGKALRSALGGDLAGEAELKNPPLSSRWTDLREKLLKISNFASLLCVLDCTVLPAVTLLLPLVGLGASPARAAFLHELGHSAALFFVLPVGGLAALLNYLSHRRSSIASAAALGLSLVYLANGHGGPVLSRLPHDLAHSLHCGTKLHRATNLLGCALLLGSNYRSHKLGCAASGLSTLGKGGNCGHDHSHSHGHDCGHHH